MTKKRVQPEKKDEVQRLVRVEYKTYYYEGPLQLRADDPDPERAREYATSAVIEHMEAVTSLMRFAVPGPVTQTDDADELARMVRGLGTLLNELTQNLAVLTDPEGGIDAAVQRKGA